MVDMFVACVASFIIGVVVTLLSSVLSFDIDKEYDYDERNPNS